MTKDNEEYFYRLMYRCDDELVEYRFNADVTMDQLVTHLKQFLKACSWTETTIDEYFPKDSYDD